jgi:hypothetical protein
LTGEFGYCSKRCAASTVSGNYANGRIAEMMLDITGEGIKSNQQLKQ